MSDQIRIFDNPMPHWPAGEHNVAIGPVFDKLRLERLQSAFDRVKEFPEFKPDERAHWLELRQAVEEYLKAMPAKENGL